VDTSTQKRSVNMENSKTTLYVTAADERGVPLRAHCIVCAWAWERVTGDDQADGLLRWARYHRCFGLYDTDELPCPEHEVIGCRFCSGEFEQIGL
jgi:hypothetical protein